MRTGTKVLALVLALALPFAASAGSLYIGGNTDVDASSEQIDASAPVNCVEVTLRSHQGNTDFVYIKYNGTATADPGASLPLTGGSVVTFTTSYSDVAGINATKFYAIGATTNNDISLTCLGK